MVNLASEKADPFSEIDAMRAVAEALRPLERDAVLRVLRWAHDHFKVQMTSARSSGFEFAPGEQPTSASNDQAGSTARFEELAELYAACQPKTDADKALVVSYWLQELQGVKGIDSRVVNDELKHLGHGVGNITRAFDSLKRTRPQLMIQTKKAGTTKQARKTYKMTVEGKVAVEQRFAGGSTQD